LRLFRRLTIALLFTIVFVSGIAGQAADPCAWNGWRGSGSGHSSCAQDKQYQHPSFQLEWKRDIPGSGFSSPVVAGGSVYVTSAEALGKKLPFSGLLWSACALGCAMAFRLARISKRSRWVIAVPALGMAAAEILLNTEPLYHRFIEPSDLARTWILLSVIASVSVVVVMSVGIDDSRIRLGYIFACPFGIWYLLRGAPDLHASKSGMVVEANLPWIYICAVVGVLSPLIRLKWGIRVAVSVSVSCLLAAAVLPAWGEPVVLWNDKLWIAIGLLAGALLYVFSRAMLRQIGLSAAAALDRRLGFAPTVLLLAIVGVYVAAAYYREFRLGLEGIGSKVSLESGKLMATARYPISGKLVPSLINSRASTTPVIIAPDRLIIYSGAGGLHAFDLDLASAWSFAETPLRTSYGVATSPVGYADRILLASDSDRNGSSRPASFVRQ